nr:immunoglobulin light chain junction region [Macaca mulatta]
DYYYQSYDSSLSAQLF